MNPERPLEKRTYRAFAEVRETLTPAEEKFELWRRTVALFAGPLVFVVLFFLPIPGLSSSAHRLAAVLGLVLTYWIGEAIPIPVTALLGAGLCILFGVAPPNTVLAPFADPIVFLFIGSFILAEAMMVHGLDRRFAYSILSLKGVGRSPQRLLFVYGGIAAFMSMWISNTATTAMMFPIGLGILYAMAGIDPQTQGARLDVTRMKFSTALMLMVAYAASVGGIGTPVGTPPNLIGIGMIARFLGVRISFFQWMLFAVPLLLVMYGLLFLLILRLHRPETERFAGAAEWIREETRNLGAWKPGERNCLIAFLLAVFLWVFPGFLAVVCGSESALCRTYSNVLPEGMVAVFAASLLFVLPTNWKEREFTLSWSQAARIDWGTILLFGGGLSLGGLMFQTKLAEAIGKGLLQVTGAHTLWGITASAIALGIVISETTSNTASANMVTPVAIALSKAAGVSGIPPALGACLGASFGFMLPVSTPPNAIVYGSGMIPIIKMIRAGIVFDVCGFFLIWLGLRVLCPLMGWA